MRITYDKVKNDIWEVIKNQTDFVYEPSSDCDVCQTHSDWEYDPEGYSEEPDQCFSHYDHDACRYFYANNRGDSDYDAPACVVGNWFVFEKFTEQELGVGTWDELEGQGVKVLLERSNLEVDDEALNFLNNMQTFQDTGISWGNAYEMSVAKAEGTE